MNAKLSRQMTLLGLGVLAFYAGLLGTGQASLEILPQFAISAVIFLSSAELMRQIGPQLGGGCHRGQYRGTLPGQAGQHDLQRIRPFPAANGCYHYRLRHADRTLKL